MSEIAVCDGVRNANKTSTLPFRSNCEKSAIDRPTPSLEADRRNRSYPMSQEKHVRQPRG
jgi:hypothetical protein